MWSLHLMTSEERERWIAGTTREERRSMIDRRVPPVVLEWEREDEEWEASYGRDAEDARSG